MDKKLTIEDTTLVINSWLQNTDGLYIDGRLLWLQFGHQGACICLWLSLEQIMKLLILQKDVINGIYEVSSKDFPTIAKLFNQRAKVITSGKHTIKPLISEFESKYPNLLSENDKTAITKINEYFERRYPKNEGSSLDLNLLDEIDRIYFAFRDAIDEGVTLSTIDEIGSRKECGISHPIESYFRFAYINNQFFHRRPVYPEWNVMYGNGVIYTDKGSHTPITTRPDTTHR